MFTSTPTLTRIYGPMETPPRPPLEIRVTFPEPTPGYWNGGRRTGGTFTVERPRPHPGPGHYIRWGAYELNFWFTAGSGTSWAAAAAYARARLRAMVAPSVQVEIIETED